MARGELPLPPASGLMVWKSNELIRTAMYEMSTREIKLLFTAVSRIQQRHGDSFEAVSLTVRELADMLELERAAVYSDVKAMAETLTGRVVRLHDPHTKTHLWTNWCEVTYTEGSGCVSILFREALRPYLLSLKEKFTQYGLDNILRLTSAYHIRLYEFLKSWESWGKPVSVPMGDLRRTLGAETKGYDQYFIFNGSVLKPAHHAINRLTDVRYHYRPLKQGRAVTAVEFTVRRRPPVQPELPFQEDLGAGVSPQPAAAPAAAPAPAPAPEPTSHRPPRRATPAARSVPRGDQPAPAAAGAPTGADADRELGDAVVAHWNARMPHSPIADTGPGRREEVARQVRADAHLHAHWGELIDTVAESKTWNGRGPRGRDGQPFHASFRWFLDHLAEVADAAAARRAAGARRRAKAPPPSATPAPGVVVDGGPAGDEERRAGAAQLRQLRSKLRGAPPPASNPVESPPRAGRGDPAAQTP